MHECSSTSCWSISNCLHATHWSQYWHVYSDWCTELRIYLCDIVEVRYLCSGFRGNWTSWAYPADLDWVLNNLLEECIQCHCPVTLQKFCNQEMEACAILYWNHQNWNCWYHALDLFHKIIQSVPGETNSEQGDSLKCSMKHNLMSTLQRWNLVKTDDLTTDTQRQVTLSVLTGTFRLLA